MRTGAPSLAAYQHAFAGTLCAPAGEAPGLAALARQPAFAVYRNTVMKGCIDTLQANYPAVARLVGEEWFRAAAAEFVRRSPPRDPVLLTYGAEFPEFLAGFPPAADLPYLARVARLDRFWTESHVAADALPADPAALAALAPESLAASRLAPHPAARWAWFDALPAYTIWSRNRAEPAGDEGLPWRGEGALVTRPRGAVQWRELDRAGCAFLDACAAGATAGGAAASALDADPAAGLARLISRLLEAGALMQTTPLETQEGPAS
jgi:hypothetical protein